MTERLVESIFIFGGRPSTTVMPGSRYIGLSQKEEAKLILDQIIPVFWKNPDAAFEFIMYFNMDTEITKSWTSNLDGKISESIRRSAKNYVANYEYNTPAAVAQRRQQAEYEQKRQAVAQHNAWVAAERKRIEEQANRPVVTAPSSTPGSYNSGSAWGSRSTPTPTYAPVITRGTYNDPYRKTDEVIRRYSR